MDSSKISTNNVDDDNRIIDQYTSNLMQSITKNLKDKKYEFVMTGGALEYFISKKAHKKSRESSL